MLNVFLRRWREQPRPRRQRRVLDNLTTHREAFVGELLERAGAPLSVALSPYYSSPDCNPIEPSGSQFKALLRSLAARTADTLQDAFHFALSAITPAHERSWPKGRRDHEQEAASERGRR
jgi:hypothetical protein